MKTVSVIIAAYRAQCFIGEAIESVLHQTLPPGYALQLLVVMDGCEATWRAVQSIQHPALSIFRMQKNGGTYVAFNSVMPFAVGELIARFDADDIMLAGYLEKQIRLLERNPMADITRTWSVYTDADKTPIRTLLGDGTWTSELGHRKQGSNGQMLFRRKVWEQLGGFKDWVCVCDTDFLIRAQYQGLLLKEVEEFLYLRRVHQESLTQSLSTGVGSSIREHYNDIVRANLANGLDKVECCVVPRTAPIRLMLPSQPLANNVLCNHGI